MSLDVLLQILRAFESLPAEVAFMRLQRNVDADVRCDVVTLHSRSTAISPLASQVQVVSALAANMAFANVVLIDVQYLCNDRRNANVDLRKAAQQKADARRRLATGR